MLGSTRNQGQKKKTIVEKHPSSECCVLSKEPQYLESESVAPWETYTVSSPIKPAIVD